MLTHLLGSELSELEVAAELRNGGRWSWARARRRAIQGMRRWAGEKAIETTRREHPGKTKGEGRNDETRSARVLSHTDKLSLQLSPARCVQADGPDAEQELLPDARTPTCQTSSGGGRTLGSTPFIEG